MHSRNYFFITLRSVLRSNYCLLLIAVDVLEVFLQYEVASDGEVILKHRDDTICNVDSFFCNLPAGGKLPPKKRATKKKKKKDNENKRNEEKKERRKKWKKKKRNERKEGRKNEKKGGLRGTFITLNFLKHL